MRAKVHITLIIIALMCLGASLSMAAALSSRQTGAWSSSKTWDTWIAKTGTITVTSGSAAVTGSGTSFTTELSLGNVLVDTSEIILGTILSISDDANLTLAANATTSYTGLYYAQRVPTAADDVTILSGDSVWGGGNASSLTVQSGAKINQTASFTCTSGGAFTLAAGSWWYANYGSATKLPGGFGTYNIDPASNWVFTSSASSSLCNALPALYGNVYIYKGGSVFAAAASVTNINIQGNIWVNASGNVKLSNNKSSALTTIHVGGNIQIISGNVGLVDAPLAGGQTCIVTVDGDVIVGDASTAPSAAVLACVSASDAGTQRTAILNISGNLSYINGAKFEAGTSTSSTNTSELCIINLYGNLSTDATVVTATNTKGIFAFNFKGNGTQTVTLGAPLRFASTTMLMTMCDTIAAGSNVVFNGGYSWSSSSVGAVNGDGQWIVNGSLALGATDTISGVQAFTLNSGATLETANPNGLASNGNIQVTGTQTYSTGANYEYNGPGPQVTGALLPATVNNLTIDNVNGVALSQATTMDGVLLLSAGVLDNSVNPIVLGPSGSVVSTGGGLNIPLPVEMTSFIASAEGLNAKLCWKTATETNNYGFEIERRSISNSQWSKIGFVAGAGTSTSQREYSYFDKGLATGKYVYRIKQVDNSGTFKYSFSTEVEIGMAKVLRLEENYPNPFNPTTIISYQLPVTSYVGLRVYDMLGREVAVLQDGMKEAGYWTATFDASKLSSGVYFSRLTVKQQEGNAVVQVKKMLMVK